MSRSKRLVSSCSGSRSVGKLATQPGQLLQHAAIDGLPGPRRAVVLYEAAVGAHDHVAEVHRRDVAAEPLGDGAALLVIPA